jgi:hypothetical protein
MSYAFDTLMAVWRRRVEPLIEDRDLAMMFEMLFEEMHSANHSSQRPDGRGTMRGDAVNKHVGVGRAVRRLDQKDREMEGVEILSERDTVQTIRRNEQRVMLRITADQLKTIFMALGREIRKRTNRLEKKEREGTAFVPEPGHRNIEVLTLERFQGVDTSLRAQIEFDMDDPKAKPAPGEGEGPPPDYGCTPKGGE